MHKWRLTAVCIQSVAASHFFVLETLQKTKKKFHTKSLQHSKKSIYHARLPQRLLITSPTRLAFRTINMVLTSDPHIRDEGNYKAEYLPAALNENEPLLASGMQTQSARLQGSDGESSSQDENDAEGSQNFEQEGSGRTYQVIDYVEEIEDYRAGGLHPVHIGDVLGSGRFTVVHKLGHGGLSTVWLARDSTEARYVTLKISISDALATEKEIQKIHDHLKTQSLSDLAGRFICLPQEQFVVEGPNGKHQCTIFPVCGPSIAQLTSSYLTPGATKIGLSSREAQRAGLQATQAIAFLHSKDVGIGHGDLTSGNILLDIANLDHLSTEQLYETFGSPSAVAMDTSSGEPLPASAPRYVVQAIDTVKLFAHRTGNIKIIDFGSSYRLETPPPELGIPIHYQSPELILNHKIGKEGDVWALACVIFEMRMRQRLFYSFFADPMGVAESMRDVLGRFPRTMLSDDTIDLAEPDEEMEHNLLRTQLSGLTKPTREPFNFEPDYAFNILASSGVRKAWNYFMWAVSWRPWHAKGQLIPATMSADEAEYFHDFVTETMVYESEKRPSAEKTAGHPWFSRVFEEPSQDEPEIIDMD